MTIPCSSRLIALAVTSSLAFGQSSPEELLDSYYLEIGPVSPTHSFSGIASVDVDEDLNIDPTQFQNTQTLVGSHFPGREWGLTTTYNF